MTGSTDWVAWHADYGDPSSGLSRRLLAVQLRLREAVDARPPGQIRLLSLCAGQAHDVSGALQGHSRVRDLVGRLVETDPHNVTQARERLAAAGLDGLEVLQADAGSTASSVGAVPADVVLLCGIFGNVTDDDVLGTIRATPMLCAEGAVVIWTRGRWEPDLTPAIRTTFAEVGFEEIAFDSPGPEQFAVGTARFRGAPGPLAPDRRLFTFIR